MQKILVTGASGFIAKHIVLHLLQAGYHVRGSVRSDKREAELIAAMPDVDDRLEIIRLDLEQDAGWAKALSGVDALLHTASPVTFEIPKNPEEIIRPAVDGTLRALKAAKAAGVTRVILTSSVSAIVAGHKPAEKTHFDEEDWSDLSSKKPSIYDRSKTLSERAAWEYAAKEGLALTSINPGLVLGTPLDAEYGASLGFVERVMRGKDPALPNAGFPVVDVQDVAKMHLLAFETPASIGERIIAAAGWYWIKDIAGILKEAYPQRKITKWQAPDLLIRIMALFDKDISQLVPRLGEDESVSNTKAMALLGVEFTDPKTSLLAAAKVIDARLNAEK